MEEPEKIVAFVSDFFAKKRNLTGKTILVTAGPTIEPIDPVRYISNFSSGKMGYAIAAELKERGAEVILVTGKTALTPPDGVQTVDVVTAEQMFRAATKTFDRCDAAVMCAAVADYTPQAVADTKIKKGRIGMEHRPAADPGYRRCDRERSKRNAPRGRIRARNRPRTSQRAIKAERKNMDFIVLNSLQDDGAGFGGNTNKITILRRDGSETVFGLKSKTEVAADIVDRNRSVLGAENARPE